MHCSQTHKLMKLPYIAKHMDSRLSANILSSFKYIQLSHGIANNFQSPPPPFVKQAPFYTFGGPIFFLLMDVMTNTIEREHRSSFFQQRV